MNETLGLKATSISTNRGEMRNFSLQHKKNGSKWLRLCMAERERERKREWDKMRDARKAAVILSGHSMLAHAYPYIHLGSQRT